MIRLTGTDYRVTSRGSASLELHAGAADATLVLMTIDARFLVDASPDATILKGAAGPVWAALRSQLGAIAPSSVKVLVPGCGLVPAHLPAVTLQEHANLPMPVRKAGAEHAWADLLAAARAACCAAAFARPPSELAWRNVVVAAEGGLEAVLLAAVDHAAAHGLIWPLAAHATVYGNANTRAVLFGSLLRDANQVC